MFKYTYSPIINRVIITLMVTLPIMLWILPADYFDKGQSLCLSVLLLGETCYGCGMTRACQHLLHLDIEAAGTFNKLSYIVLPIGAYLYGKELWLRISLDPRYAQWKQKESNLQ